MIQQERIELAGPDGTIDGIVYHDPDAGPRPGVIHLTDIVGMRPTTEEMARRVAALGYTVLQPNAFYRTGQPPLFSFRPDFTEERTLKRFAELARPLTPEAVARDAGTYVEALHARADVKRGKVAVVGYCFTGAIALRIAAARPDDVAAAASFHGGGLYTDAPGSPHTVLPRVEAQLYFAHADQDRSMTEPAIKQLEAALEAWGGEYESEIYPGAVHGWTVPGFPGYAEAPAERAFHKLEALLASAL
ncbi:MAG: dienelactone hydrolase family protein [Polyangiales bacterium]